MNETEVMSRLSEVYYHTLSDEGKIYMKTLLGLARGRWLGSSPILRHVDKAILLGVGQLGSL